ncbi:MAG: hypothetical protein HYX54_05700 [Chloroflexi bacterium]|nr:hypothetical protein [Chloroflexota bacterium]
MTIRRLAMAMTVAAMMVGAMAPAALAAGGATDLQRAEAAGWGCAGAVGLPDGHCISPGTVARWPDLLFTPNGTFELRVFDANGNFVTAESATVKFADNRPCPHDEESSDGTYWDFVDNFLWVCHHRSE